MHAVNPTLHSICQQPRPPGESRGIEKEGGGLCDAVVALTTTRLREPHLCDAQPALHRAPMNSAVPPVSARTGRRNSVRRELPPMHAPTTSPQAGTHVTSATIRASASLASARAAVGESSPVRIPQTRPVPSASGKCPATCCPFSIRAKDCSTKCAWSEDSRSGDMGPVFATFTPTSAYLPQAQHAVMVRCTEEPKATGRGV